jgi:hypothetical protein
LVWEIFPIVVFHLNVLNSYLELTMNKHLYALALIATFSLTAPAQAKSVSAIDLVTGSAVVAKNGADNAPGDARRGRGADNGAGHAANGADNAPGDNRRGRGADNGAGHAKNGADNAPGDSRRGRGGDDGAGHA